jgi:alkylation response protein AidB-like acyl-CoA dehydrogenase
MAPLAIMHGGSNSQKKEYLNKIASNEISFGVGLTEYIAAREDAGIKIDGSKASGRALFVIDGDHASHFVLADKNGVMCIVRAEDAEVELVKLTSVDKTRGYFEILLNNADVDVLENSSQSAEAITKTVDAGRIMLAADSVGASQVMIDKSVEYAKERKQFGRVIGSFQAVKHMCAEMAAELEPCYAIVWHAAHCFNNVPEEARLMACQSKSHVSEVSKMVAKKATEVHGGMGFTDLLGLHYWFKRIGMNRQLLGSPELVREEAGRVQGF